MVKDSFFDTNVIIFYGKYTKDTKIELFKKCYNHIKNKKGKFIICYFLEKEIKNFIKKNKIIHKEIIEKIKNPFYDIGSSIESSILKLRDLAYAKKLYETKKHISPEILSKFFIEDKVYLEMNLEKFLEKIVDERVIPIDKIDKNLISKIHDIISNHADCKILASALQFQKERDYFLFVTADRDFSPNEYSYLKEHFEINYSKEKWNFPKLFNLVFNG